MPELRLPTRTVGEPTGEPVLVLHGTGGSGASMLTRDFRGRAVRPGPAARCDQVFHHHAGRDRPRQIVQALRRAAANSRATITTTWSTAQYRLVKEGLGIRHLRLVIGNSMGGMHTWMWGAKYPDFMDALVPMASQPTEMASRNWMMRRLMIETIRNDPDYNNGNYTDAAAGDADRQRVLRASPPMAARWPSRRLAPTRAQADKLRRRRLAAPFTADANDFLYAVGFLARLQRRRRAWSGSRPRCWRSTPPTTSATRRRPASWSASSSA